MPINDPRALSPPLRDACIAWLEAGGGQFWIVSGVRTYAEQVALWNAYQNGTGNLAARPGTSKHEKGLAVDIGGDKGLADTLSRQFGLGKTVPGEDWHYEVVNEAVASTYPKEPFTVAQYDDIMRELTEIRRIVTSQQGTKRLATRIWNKIKRQKPGQV